MDLRELRADDLEPLLQRKSEPGTRRWTGTSGKSADLVRRFVDLRALNGCALMQAARSIGYAYFVLEDHKGLIGDLYFAVIPYGGTEIRLLDAVLDEMMGTPHLARIESQLMMVEIARRPQPCPARAS